MLRVRLCGGVGLEVDDRRLPDTLLAGRQGRLALAYLVCERHRSVSREELAELLWGEQLPASWPASLSAIVSKLRRLLGEAGLDGSDALASAFGSYRLYLPDDTWIDWEAAGDKLELAERALCEGDAGLALAAAAEVEAIVRLGFLTDDCAWVDGQRERVRDVLVRAVQTRAEAHLLTTDRPRSVEAAREVLALEPLRESAYRLLMRALAAAGERGEALRVWEQCRKQMVEELGSDPAPETEAVYLEILRDDPSPSSLPSGVVTFLLTDIVDSSGLWERQPSAMATALERHDRLVTEIARSHGGTLLKAKLEGDATVSVFARATSGALAALALVEALTSEPWPEGAAPLVRMALHTGEAFERDGDFFGPALNRAARLRSVADGGQILVSQAHAELVRDHLPDHAALRGLGHRELRGLARGEDVYELRTASEDDSKAVSVSDVRATFVPPLIPSALSMSGPFVGRGEELERLAVEWENALAATPRIVLLGGEPGVGKTRLASERARQVHDLGGVVLYGRCDEDLGAPYQPFGEALRTLLPCVGGERLAAVRGVEQLIRLVPELSDLVPGLLPAHGGDPDADRYALFDALARVLVAVSAEVPMLLVLDDLHWANKATLLMLRHVLRFGEGARVQILGTYRTTDLDPAHPLAATLADLHRDGTANRLVLGGLAQDDVTAYLDAAGYEDEELGRAVASVTAGNPFFMIEVLRHVEESGGRWDPSTLPQGVREAVGRRLARLTPEANETLLAGAVFGGRFSLELVEHVVGRDLIDGVSEACDAGIVVEEAGGWFRFNHAIVRRSLLAGVASVKRVRLHQRIAEHLEAAPSPTDDRLADLAHHYFESAWAGNAAKAVEYCRRAAEQAMERLAFEGAADLYDRAVQALDIDDSTDRASERSELLLARCEALLAAGEVTSATEAVARLEESTAGSPRLAAWATCFAGQLAVLSHPDQLDTIVGAVAAAADQLAELDDAAGEAKAHTVRASCLARLGRIADCETALDRALTAARRAGDHRRVNAVLAGAPLAALWGPHPVPRAGGRCLDVIRLLRITTGSAAVEATSTRCQAVLEAFRGRAPAARHMLDTARQSLTNLGLRHGLLEVDLFAGIVELVADDPTAAERYLRRAYAGFRRLGVGADTAQAAALLARAHAALGREREADELCAESERLAGHDLKASIAWRTVRAQLLAAQGEHAEARRLAEAAVALAERTDALVDHGDACLGVAAVLAAAGDRAGARAAAERAMGLYERKGAAALVERARALLGDAAAARPAARSAADETQPAWLENACTRSMLAGEEAFALRDWEAIESGISHEVVMHIRRRIVGGEPTVGIGSWLEMARSAADVGMLRYEMTPLAVRGDRLALVLFVPRGRDDRPDALSDQQLRLWGLDGEGKLALDVFFDLEDVDAAYAELDAQYLATEAQPHCNVFETIAAAIDAYNRRDAVAAPLAPDLVHVDHRPASLPDMNEPSGLVSYLGRTVEVVPDLTMRLTAVHVLDDRGAVFTIVQSGATPEGMPIEFSLHAADLVADGLIKRIEVFPEDALDAALARFAALGSADSGLENAATRAHARFAALFAQRDWAAAGENCSDNYVHDDRRAGLRNTFHGRDEAMALARGVADIGVKEFVTTVVATRGDRSALLRMRLVGRDRRPDAFHTEVLTLVAVNRDERITDWITFDLEDSEAAFAELDVRYLAGEGAPHADILAPMFGAMDVYNARDWQQAGLHVSAGISVVDHRPASMGAMTGSDEFLRALQVLVDLVPSMRVSCRAVHAVSEGAAVVQLSLNGTTGEGSEVELSFNVVYVAVDRRLTIWEYFPEDQLDVALARFAALGPVERGIENAATRAVDLWKPLFVERDWESLSRLIAEDILVEDRRHVMEYVSRGRTDYLEQIRALGDIGVADVEFTVLATRGDRSVLLRSRFVGRDRRPDAFSTVVLQVIEADNEGRLNVCVQFDIDDEDAAFAELNARYLAGEGAAHANTLGPLFEAMRLYNARDWLHIATGLADDFSMVDHRLASLEAVDGADEFIRSIQPLTDLAPSVRARARMIHAVGPGAAVVQMNLGGSTVDGSDIEFGFHTVCAVRAGQLTNWEFFAEDQLPAAQARFEELRGAGSDLENAAARAHNRFATKFVQRDWESVATVFTEDSVYDDRRRVLGGIYRGRGDVVAMAKGVADIGVSDFVTNVLATRGDRLCLRRTRLVGRDRRPEAFHTDLLQVFEVDASGRIALWVTFDLDQLDAAYAELEARYVADEAAPHTGAWQLVVDNNAALSRRKFAPVTSDFEFVDHRRGGASIGTGQVTAYMRATFEDTPDAQYRTTAVHALADHGAVVCVSVEGTSQHGFEAVWSLLNVIIVRDGRIARIEFFADDDLDAARARFEQLAPSHVALENAATRVVRRLQSAVNRASWDDMESLLASDFTQEDRRRDRLGLPVVSRRAYLAGAQASEAIGLTHVEGMVLATRGDRLALVQQVLRGADDRPDASRWEWLCIGGVDGAGLCAISIWFDPDDFDAALAELEALYIAGEASAHAEVWRLVTDVYASYNRHEFPAVAPGFASVDHRRASFAPGELAADLQGLFELVPDIRFRITAVHALDEHGAVITSTAEGRSADGFDARWANVHVITVRDGQVAGMEMYPDDQIDAAVARFAQLAQSQPALANAATRTIERMHAAFNGDRWDDDADWLAADFTQEDRRRDRLGLPVVSRRAFVAGARAWRELPALIPHVEGTPLALRGDRLALGLDSIGGNDDQPGAPRWEYLFVFGVDDHGRCNSQVWFDPDDLDAAYAELDARYLAGEAAPFAETWATMVEIFAAYNARDSARFRGLLSDDIVDVDHRPASLGFTKGMWSLVPDIAFRVVSVPALASHGAVMQVAGTGTSTSGMAAEWSLVQLALVESGLVTRVEIFPDDQLDAALARLAELDADAPV